MISNDRKQYYDIPDRLLYAGIQLQAIVSTGNKKLIDEKIYKGEKNIAGVKVYEVRETLCEIYYFKCAYCETKEHKPDVEHYRPKKGVSGLEDHDGYYWLCYEWTNLIPSCRFCNAESGKWNKFPIAGQRQTQPPLLADGHLDIHACNAANVPLSDELPMLFHPEIDEPEQAFAFETNGGIIGIDVQDRGAQTIQICDLDRENLKYRRQCVIDDIILRLKDAFTLAFELDQSVHEIRLVMRQIFVRLKQKCAPDQEFSLMACYAFDHLDTMIVPLASANNETLKDMLLDAYHDYLNGNL